MIAPTQTKQAIFLKTASQIGQRLIQSAIWEGDTCTWEVSAPDLTAPVKVRRSIRERTSGTLYQGTAGIALFLAELYGMTHDPDVADAAHGALLFALDQKMPISSFGFHSGRVGVAYVVWRASQLLDFPEADAEIDNLLRPMLDQTTNDMGIDVIGGAGGAIPALLCMADTPARDYCLTLARQLGDNLINVARRDPYGWSWGSAQGTSLQNMTGYAHGAAGLAHALYELFQTTGDSRYQFSAEQALLYERHHFQPEHGNWPDWRYADLGEYVMRGQYETVREMLNAGTFPPYEMTCMTAWCHGAPGIGLLRLRLTELYDAPIYEAEARVAVETTVPSITDNPHWNYSLCHGYAGNAETLVYAAHVFNEPRWLEMAEQIALAGYEQYEAQNRTWPCGTMSSEYDPSLMLGEAGIGHFYLRLVNPEVPSVVFVTPPVRHRRDGGSSADLRQTHLNHYFKDSITTLNELGYTLELPPLKVGMTTTDIHATYQQIEQCIRDADPVTRQQIEAASDVERTRYALRCQLTNLTDELLKALQRPLFDTLDLETVRFQRATLTRLVECDEQAHVLYRTKNDIVTAPISPFTALLLEKLVESQTVTELVEGVQESVGAESAEQQAALRNLIIQQLAQLYYPTIIDSNHPKSMPLPIVQQSRCACGSHG